MRAKNISFIALLLMALFAGGSANAQGVGNLLRKTKKIFEKVVGAPNISTMVINPISQYIEVVPIGLFGTSYTETSGNVYLALRVLNKTEKQNALFGSSVQNQKMLAVDGAGNVYNIDGSGGIRYDTPQDVPVKVVIDNPQLQFMNVSNSLNIMPVVKIGISLDAYHQGNLTFKNLPIFWDVSPDEIE